MNGSPRGNRQAGKRPRAAARARAGVCCAPLFASTLALLAAGLTASAAYAATGSAHPAGGHRASTAATWSVSESVDTGGASKVVLTDRTTGSKIKCDAQFDYLFTQKMGLPSDIATFNIVPFSNCTLPGRAAITLAASTAKMPMMALSFNPRRNLGVTSGEFTGLDVSLSGSGCSGVLEPRGCAGPQPEP